MFSALSACLATIMVAVFSVWLYCATMMHGWGIAPKSWYWIMFGVIGQGVLVLINSSLSKTLIISLGELKNDENIDGSQSNSNSN